MYRCQLIAGTAGDITLDGLLLTSAKESLKIFADVACKDSCHKPWQSVQHCETLLSHTSCLPFTQTVGGKVGYHLRSVSMHARCTHMLKAAVVP